MNKKYDSPLLRKYNNTKSVYQKIMPVDAGWDYLHFETRILKEGEIWHYNTGSNEFIIVILGGKCSVESTAGNWFGIGGRKNVFDGMPYALYLPGNIEFSIYAETEILDIAYGWCATEEQHYAYLIKPEDSKIEIRGGGNATRQINSILPPGSKCNRLVAVEVYTPSGNWSSYPPHKHDKHIEKNGKLIEADLEEIYFYKFDKPAGYAIQRVYNDDKTLDEIICVENNDLVLVPEGYHPVAAAHGYNTYYLNILAGSAQSLMASDDPEHEWIKKTWDKKDPRLPLVSLNGRNVKNII
jgi:5-deoxy-glucuronate isomerase